MIVGGGSSIRSGESGAGKSESSGGVELCTDDLNVQLKHDRR